MVLIEELGAVFALSEEDLAATRMYFSVFSDVVYNSLINCPTVFVRLVERYLLSCIVGAHGVFCHGLYLLGFLHELALTPPILHRHLNSTQLAQGSIRTCILMLRGLRKLINVKGQNVMDLLDLTCISLFCHDSYQLRFLIEVKLICFA